MSKLSGFGAALKKLRRGADGQGTLVSLAVRSRIDASELSKYELEKQWPSREVLERLLDGLGISFLDLAIEVERQQRIARGDGPGLPASSPTPEVDFEARVRAIVRQEFLGGLQKIAGLESSEIATIASFVREAGGHPDLEAVALLKSILDRGV